MGRCVPGHGGGLREGSVLLSVVNFVIIEGGEHVLIVFEAVLKSLVHQGGVDNAILFLEPESHIGGRAGVKISARELGDAVAMVEE